MASMLSSEKDITNQIMFERCVFVHGAIRTACPEVRDKAWMERRTRLQQGATYKTLFKRMGYDDPSVGTSANFIAWSIDCGLWHELQNPPMDNTAFNELFESPSPTDMPYS